MRSFSKLLPRSIWYLAVGIAMTVLQPLEGRAERYEGPYCVQQVARIQWRQLVPGIPGLVGVPAGYMAQMAHIENLTDRRIDLDLAIRYRGTYVVSGSLAREGGIERSSVKEEVKGHVTLPPRAIAQHYLILLRDVLQPTPEPEMVLSWDVQPEINLNGTSCIVLAAGGAPLVIPLSPLESATTAKKDEGRCLGEANEDVNTPRCSKAIRSGELSVNVIIDGWQKAKFGMSLSEVHKAFPEAKLFQRASAKECTDKLGLKRDENGVLTEVPTLSCNGLTATFKAERDQFSVRFDFDYTKEELERVTLSILGANIDTFEYYRRLLSEKYGVGNNKDYNTSDDICRQSEERYKNGGFFPYTTLIMTREIREVEYKGGAGGVVLRFDSPKLCDWYFSRYSPPSMSLDPKIDLARPNLRSLEIRYQRDRPLAPSDKGHF